MRLALAAWSSVEGSVTSQVDEENEIMPVRSTRTFPPLIEEVEKEVKEVVEEEEEDAVKEDFT